MDAEYGSLSRVDRSVGGLLGWQQSVLIDMDRDAFDNETFDEFGNERRQMGDAPVEAGDVWIQCGFLRIGMTSAFEPILADWVKLHAGKRHCTDGILTIELMVVEMRLSKQVGTRSNARDLALKSYSACNSRIVV